MFETAHAQTQTSDSLQWKSSRSPVPWLSAHVAYDMRVVYKRGCSFLAATAEQNLRYTSSRICPWPSWLRPWITRHGRRSSLILPGGLPCLHLGPASGVPPGVCVCVCVCVCVSFVDYLLSSLIKRLLNFSATPTFSLHQHVTWQMMPWGSLWCCLVWGLCLWFLGLICYCCFVSSIIINNNLLHFI